jgi:hypothetical protein
MSPSKRSLDEAKRNPGFTRQTLLGQDRPPKTVKAIRDECANESMTNTNPQVVVPARVSRDCSGCNPHAGPNRPRFEYGMNIINVLLGNAALMPNLPGLLLNPL